VLIDGGKNCFCPVLEENIIQVVVCAIEKTTSLHAPCVMQASTYINFGGIMGFFDFIKSSTDSKKHATNRSPKETGGPVVKTGPTRGQNRSRNDDGSWRKKRSDAE
jgi:hypothetical protein